MGQKFFGSRLVVEYPAANFSKQVDDAIHAAVGPDSERVGSGCDVGGPGGVRDIEYRFATTVYAWAAQKRVLTITKDWPFLVRATVGFAK